MKVFKEISEWLEFKKGLSEKSIGFVPTMGALHSGHKSLIEESLKNNEITIVSIFLNPTQFDNETDLDKYPTSIESDIALLKKLNIDILLIPNYKELYPDNYSYKINESKLSQVLCGKSRPGHFDGVLTVVMKLLNIVNADNAYFGEKDYQQYLLIKGMCNAFFMSTNIVPMPLIRDNDGLALSSRNKRLKDSERTLAPHLYKVLNSKLSLVDCEKELINKGFDIDYLEDINERRYAAVYLGDVRLIDNVKI